MSDYSIWVLEYSFVPAVPRGLTIQGAFNQGTCKLPYCYVLIKGRGHLAMVDVGYNDKDYGAVMAKSFNVPCERVMYKKDLRAAMQRMLDSKEPYVLDVIVPYTEHVLPFIPAGKTVADMIWKV